MVYAALDGWRRQMVERGRALFDGALALASEVRASIEDIEGFSVLDDELMGAEASHDLDRLQVLIDVSRAGASGYQAADWLREHRFVDVGMADHRRILATLSFADDVDSARLLLGALVDLRSAIKDFEMTTPIALPDPAELELETAVLPRDAFFGPTEMVSAGKAAGRIAAEQITPYPPGIPAVVPGERLNDAVIDYLRSGLAAGMTLPDPADPTLQNICVTA
jgi:lysine decarboxylase